MAIVVFSLATWFCFLLELAWYSEAYLCKGLRCDWSLPLTGACWPERVLARLGPSLPAPSRVRGPCPALLPPVFMDLHQTVTLQGVGDLTI